MRPLANVTNPDLAPADIDKQVRGYISEKYASVLIQNYEQLYARLKKEKKDFSDCRSPVAINEKDEEVLSSLCLTVNDSFADVVYLTNPYSQGWKTASVFTFMRTEEKFRLISIDLQLLPDQKVYVEGI